LEILTKYYNEHYAVFKENFIKALYSFDPAAIHKMRTSTKRLRALFLLIQFLSPDNFKAKKQLKKIRQLFRFTGRIREIQTEQLLVYELEQKLDQNFLEYREYLLIKEDKEISKFMKSLPDLDRGKNIVNNEYILSTLEGLEGTKIKAKSKKFLLKKSDFIKNLNSKKTSNTKIHKNRTAIKQVYYLYDVLTILADDFSFIESTKTELRELEQQIGTWHDKVNSFHFVNAFFKTKNGKKTAKYKLLKQQIIEDRDRMRKEIVKILKKGNILQL